MAVVDREPRPNVARTLLAALRDDWQLPVKERNRKPGTETLKEAGFSQEQIELVKQNSFYYHWTKSSGAGFLREIVDPVIARDKLDLLVLNPLQGFLGDNIQNTEVTVQFIRHTLLPIVEKHNAAALIFHHTPKTNFRNTQEWRASDWMYAGAGSADLTNAMRAIIVQDPTSKSGHFATRVANFPYTALPLQAWRYMRLALRLALDPKICSKQDDDLDVVKRDDDRDDERAWMDF